ncbi:MAG: pyridoxal-phosphate dependent enzyme, partial [Mucinivorans sp.]
VGPHPYPAMVADFQSVISAEIRAQLLEKEGREEPDYVVACIGGGSNAMGAFYHFIDSPKVQLIAAEAGGMGSQTGKTAATMTVGRPAVLHGSRTMVLLDDKDQVMEPYSLSAGLDYPGVGPLAAHLSHIGRMQAISINDDEAIRAAMELTRLEGIIPALESAHALAVLEKIKEKLTPETVVVINLSGRGDKDIEMYLSMQGK